MASDGPGSTETVTKAMFVQVPLLPTTVYCVVTVGLTVISEPVRDGGSHAYTNAPVAVSVDVPPMHIVVGFALARIVGVGLTLTVITVEAMQEPLEPLRV